VRSMMVIAEAKYSASGLREFRKEMSERIVPGFPGQIQGVRETVVQVTFDRQRLVKRSLGVFRYLFGKLRDALIKRRELQVRFNDIR